MRKIVYIALSGVLLTSCVTKKKFNELTAKYDDIYEEKVELIAKNDKLLKEAIGFKETIKGLEEKLVVANNRIAVLEQQMSAANAKNKNLQQAYDVLSSKSSSALNAKAKENQQLLADLEAKEDKIIQEQAELRKLQAALDARSKRIQDLEQLIADKEAAMQGLKSAISNALKGFEGKGLTVEQRNGKVYVSMENKLLFRSGQWAVGTTGKKAVIELAKVLVQNPTIEVLIEGHTDDDPFKKGGVIQDNWDLSVKRATAIVRILQSQKVSPQQITAAGRSEYVPVASNETSAGKAKNRRIEIVLSPNLDEVTKLLNE